MKVSVVQVKRSELCTQQLIVPPWEVPVLQAVHGDSSVHVVGTATQDRELPDPQSEYERLARRYGHNPEKSEVPYVGLVYGQFGAGVAALADAMERSQAQARETAERDEHERSPARSGKVARG